MRKQVALVLVMSPICFLMATVESPPVFRWGNCWNVVLFFIEEVLAQLDTASIVRRQSVQLSRRHALILCVVTILYAQYFCTLVSLRFFLHYSVDDVNWGVLFSLLALNDHVPFILATVLESRGVGREKYYVPVLECIILQLLVHIEFVIIIF